MENKFKFKKGDIEFEWSGDKEFVESQIKEWKTHITDLIKGEELLPNLQSISTSNNEQNNINNIPYNEIKVIKNITIDDFINLKCPDNETDKVLVAGYYMERYEKYESFNELDLYRILNIPDIESYLTINTEKGYMDFIGKINNLNTYTLTYLGEIYVREGLEHI